MSIVLRGARCLMGDSFSFDGEPHDVLVENGRISAIGAAGSLSGTQTMDLSRHLLAPGLINGHFHSHEHFQKGRTENLPLELWQHYVRTPVPVVLNARQTYLRTLIGAIEALRTGTTTVLDDLAVGAAVDRANVDAAFQAYDDIGIRALVGFAMMNRPLVDNFPFAEEAFRPQMLERLRAMRPAPEAQFEALCADLARKRHPKAARVGLAVSLSAPQRCTEDFLLRWRRFADQHELPLVTHVQETRMQVVTGQQFYGQPIVEYLDRIGFLAPRTSLIHAVWLNPREIDALARSGTTAQHNPWSNLLLGSGVQPTRALLDAGVNVSMGTDGTCSTATCNLLTAAGSGAALSNLRGNDYDRWVAAKEILKAATLGGAKAFGFEGELGLINPGAVADLVGYRLDAPAFVPLNDPVRQLIYGERGAGVDFVMVDGKAVIESGRFVTIDEPALIAEIAEEHARLRPQFDKAEASVQPLLEGMEAIYRRSLATAIPSDTYAARLP
jgi:5-methylthioadenosine/S-adenosylhomocysteine deaminase